MKCYAQFFLPGCAEPLPDEYETFHSISNAKRKLIEHWERTQQFADGSATMWLFLGEPNTEVPYPCDTHPDRVYLTGPRGGVVRVQ